MNKVVLYLAMSIDGYIAGPNEDLSWLNDYNGSNEKEDLAKEERDNPYSYDPFFANVGAIILGRNTYDLEIRNGWGDVHPVPKFVLSKRTPHPNAKKDEIFTDEDIEEVVKKAKRLTDKTIWIEGGANVAQQFIARDLLDEAVLFVVPVLLGGSISLFGKLDAYKKWNLRNIRKLRGGMIQLEYNISRPIIY